VCAEVIDVIGGYVRSEPDMAKCTLTEFASEYECAAGGGRLEHGVRPKRIDRDSIVIVYFCHLILAMTCFASQPRRGQCRRWGRRRGKERVRDNASAWVCPGRMRARRGGLGRRCDEREGLWSERVNHPWGLVEVEKLAGGACVGSEARGKKPRERETRLR
jgi:hypothetical protein